MENNPQITTANMIIDFRDAFIARGVKPLEAMAYAISFTAQLVAEVQHVTKQAPTGYMDIGALFRNSDKPTGGV